MAASTSDDYKVVRFSSASLPEQERGKALEELRERGQLLATRFTPYGASLPHVDLANRIVPGLRILTATYAGVRHESFPVSSAGQGGDDLCLCMILTGQSLVRQGGREMVLGDGDAVLVTAETAWTFTSDSPVNVAGLRLSRAEFAPLVPNLDDALMHRVAREARGLRLLRKYLDVTADDEALAARPSQRVITGHFYDLAALALGAVRDGERLPQNSGVRAARLAAIKADIIAHLHDGDLNATTVAARNRVTLRYLHKLFENEGVTYSEFVLTLRLAKAYSILRSPLHAHRAIASVAFELGFNDLSYFNRTFRRRYDATPSDVRYGIK